MKKVTKKIDRAFCFHSRCLGVSLRQCVPFSNLQGLSFCPRKIIFLTKDPAIFIFTFLLSVAIFRQVHNFRFLSIVKLGRVVGRTKFNNNLTFALYIIFLL